MFPFWLQLDPASVMTSVAAVFSVLFVFFGGPAGR